MSVVMAFRLSLPRPDISGPAGPEPFDHVRAREEISLSSFLDAFTARTEGENSNSKACDNFVSATRVIFGVVKTKFNARVDMETPFHGPGSAGCPMLNGSLDPYLDLWDPDLVPMPSQGSSALCPAGSSGSSVHTGNSSGNGGSGGDTTRPPIFHDLWATMTMGWANTN